MSLYIPGFTHTPQNKFPRSHPPSSLIPFLSGAFDGLPVLTGLLPMYLPTSFLDTHPHSSGLHTRYVCPPVLLRTSSPWLAVSWQHRRNDKVMLEPDLSHNFPEGWGGICSICCVLVILTSTEDGVLLQRGKATCPNLRVATVAQGCHCLQHMHCLSSLPRELL